MTNNIVDFNKELQSVGAQNIYLQLINDRNDKVEDEQHKEKVMSGYNKIMSFIAKGMTVQQRKIQGGNYA